MSIAEEYIQNTRREIAEARREALSLTIWGSVLKWAVETLVLAASMASFLIGFTQSLSPIRR